MVWIQETMHLVGSCERDCVDKRCGLLQQIQN
jgi:hypothetical protein